MCLLRQQCIIYQLALHKGLNLMGVFKNTKVTNVNFYKINNMAYIVVNMAYRVVNMVNLSVPL